MCTLKPGGINTVADQCIYSQMHLYLNSNTFFFIGVHQRNGFDMKQNASGTKICDEPYGIEAVF